MTTTLAMPAIEERRALPTEWRWVRLEEVCHVANGSTPSSSTKAYWDGEIVWITPTDLGKLCGRDIFDSERHISKAGYANSGTELVPAGTVVMSSRAPIGHLGIARVPLCTNQGCKSFVPKPEIDTQYLYYALKLSVPAIRTLGSGSTFTEVSKTQLEQFAISLPPLPEQRRIAALLDDAMRSVEQAQAAAQARLEAARALPAALLREVFEGEEARGWEKTLLEKVSGISTGTTPSTNNPSYYRGSVPFIKTAQITNNRIISADVYISEEAVTDYGMRLYPQGTVLLAMYGQGKTRGQAGLLEIAATTTQNAAAIVPGNSLDSEYLWLWLLSLYEKLRRMGYQGDLSHLSLEYVKSLEIPLPSKTLQQEVAARLEASVADARASVTILHDQLAAIDALPAALLRRAFSGEL